MTAGTVLALAAAVCFALGSVFQQKGTLETDAGSEDPRFLVQMFRRPIWLLGAVSQATGWVLQAAALDRAPLAMVQSLTTLSLVLALPLGARLTSQHISRRVMLGAVGVVVGIVVFLSVGAPSSGSTTPSAAEWWGAGLITLGLVVGFALLARGRSGSLRAALLGAAAGFAFGLQGAVTKVFVTEIGGGVLALLLDWSPYVLVLSALVGLAFQQGALKTGVLAPAVASANAVTLFMGVVLGLSVFDEALQPGVSRVPAVIGLAVALAGVCVLASAESTGPDLGIAGSGQAA